MPETREEAGSGRYERTGRDNQSNALSRYFEQQPIRGSYQSGSDRTFDQTALQQFVRLRYLRPRPPRELKSQAGLLSWKPAAKPDTFEVRPTHWRIYANTDADAGLVRELPIGQLYLQDNLEAATVYVSAYSQPLNRESPRIPFPEGSIRPGSSAPRMQRATFNQVGRAIVADGLSDLQGVYYFVATIPDDYKITLTEVWVSASHPPVGAGTSLMLWLSTDDGVTWSAALTAPIVLTGRVAVVSNFVTVPTVLLRGDRLRFEVSAISSPYPGANLSASALYDIDPIL